MTNALITNIDFMEVKKPKTEKDGYFRHHFQ